MLERGCKDFVEGRGFVLECWIRGGGRAPGGGTVPQTKISMLKAGIKRPLRFFYAVSFPRMFFF